MRNITDLMLLQKQGTPDSITVTWQEISSGYEEIIGGSGDNILGSWQRPSTDAGVARVMVAQAQEPLADRNGGQRVLVPKKKTAPEV